jgi:hypothetical protein
MSGSVERIEEPGARERTRVIVSRSAAVGIFAEVRRWVEEGLATQGVALESLVYPLSALVPRSLARILCPVELARLEEIHTLVVDGFAAPPDSVKSFSALNCHFEPLDPARANAEFNAAIDAEIERRPRLAVLSKLHTHPFRGGAFLSGGDLHHGVTSEKAALWRERKGLATSILHVVHPGAEPVATPDPWEVGASGATARSGRREVAWRIRSWGSTGTWGEMIDLGDAEVVPDGHPLVKVTRRPPYFRTPRGSRWCDEQKATLREAGFVVSRNLLGRGWRRYLVSSESRTLLIALPPDLPAVPPRILEVRNALANDFVEIPLPDGFAGAPLPRLRLVDLARRCFEGREGAS